MNRKEKNTGRFICPSTREFFRESRASGNHSLWDFIHGYIYGRWTYLYIGVAKGRHPAARILGPLFSLVARHFPAPKPEAMEAASRQNGKITFADTYHAKVMPLEQAAKLVTLNLPLNLPDLEQVIPYKRARSIILENPDRIAVLECPCRAAEKNPCQPEDVCLVIGEPFAGFIVAHHPDKARWITQQEALAIMAAEDERGHVHHAFFKDAMLDRFYAICNCCSCCCGAMQAWQNGTPMLASSGYVAQVDVDLCAACGSCADSCPFAAISVDDGFARIDASACMGCGVCVAHCPQEAVSLLRDPAKGEPLEIQKLMARVAPVTER